MKFRSTAVRRELTRIAHDRVLILLIVAPWIVFALLAAIFVREVPHDLPVAVVDHDHSSTSRRLVRMLDASSTLAVTAAPDSAAAERALVGGDAYAVIDIPRDMERDLKRGHAVTVVCSYNAQLLLPASLIRRAVRTVTGTLSAGVELKLRTARGATTAEAMTRFEPLRLDTHNLFNPRLSYVAFLLTALVPAMLQVFIVMAAIWSAGLELRDGTSIEWLAASASTAAAFAAKAIPLFAIYSLIGVSGEWLVCRAFDVPIRFGLTLAAGFLLFTAASIGVGFAIVIGAANLRFGLSVGAFYSGPAFAFAGITFPLIGMPPLARAWSAIIPLTHVLQLLSASLRGVVVNSRPLAALAIITILSGGFAILRGRVILGDSRYWGRL